MNAARIVVLANALSAGGVATYLARGSGENSAAAEPVAPLPTTEILVGKSLPNGRVKVILSRREKGPDRGGPEIINSEIIPTNIRMLAIDHAPKDKEGMNALVGKAGTQSLRSITDVNLVVGGSDDQAPKRGSSINVVRYGIASQSTAQK
ncbi:MULTISPECIES: hypothetical protein [unclassified Bradyrhizobium]|uniref:hypothetical protein n=1 Tax=unclassified Bradyrhizobium TaxID=2631580 RepID=UPI001BA9D2B4|nr:MULTISPECIES: hypothetical protein [unclassified Bradyrhizobium]MBR1227181.1 hypothetical protein [Bradyrhizobium sp. AUGA SZCCT0176]MBR1298623.1 hypothetical protein [Bradyrhizobium sp. AUGA SZCCT0042]